LNVSGMEALFAVWAGNAGFPYREDLDQAETLWDLLARNGTGVPG